MKTLPRAVLLLLVCSGSCSYAGQQSENLLQSADPERGRQLFLSVCGAYCHSRDEGDKGAPDLFDCRWRYGGEPEAIFATISNGVSGSRMIPFAGKLPQGDQDIYNIIAYLGEASRCDSSDAAASTAQTPST